MWADCEERECCLTGSSKDIEKQIQGIQDKSDKIKGEVCFLCASWRVSC